MQGWGSCDLGSTPSIPTMKFELNLPKENTNSFMRRCGYVPEGADPKTGELRFSKSLGASYTRFHIYCVENENRIVIFNLHVDQKRPSYRGASAHNGEYSGPLVEAEAQRIQKSA